MHYEYEHCDPLGKGSQFCIIAAVERIEKHLAIHHHHVNAFK